MFSLQQVFHVEQDKAFFAMLLAKHLLQQKHNKALGMRDHVDGVDATC